MGPFALMDLIGIDVNFAVSTAVFARLPVERLRPHLLQKRLLEAGTLGRKTGSGFFRYDAGNEPEGPAMLTFPKSGWPNTIALLDPDRVLEPVAKAASPNDVTFNVVPTLDRARALGVPVLYDAYRFVRDDLRTLSAPAAGIGILRSLDDQRVLELVRNPDGSIPLELAAPLFAGGVQAIAVADLPGHYVGATIASIINEAFSARAEGVAEAADIDLAMELGVRYPCGPFAWFDRIGGDRVASILRQLAHTDPVYGPHPSLLDTSRVGRS